MALWSNNKLRRPDDGSAVCVDESRYPEPVALAKRYAIGPRNWYRRRARNVRWMFRLFGMGVILLSASLPIIAAVDFRDAPFVITVVSVGVAGLTALRTFFRWDDQWRLLKAADWKLTALIAVWEADVCAMESAGAASKRDAMRRTQLLLAEVKDVIDEEARSFFLGITWPQAEIAAQDALAAQQRQHGSNGTDGANWQARAESREDLTRGSGISGAAPAAGGAQAVAHRAQWWQRLVGRQHR